MRLNPIEGDILINADPAMKAFFDVEKRAKGFAQTAGQVLNGAGRDSGKEFAKGLNAEMGKAWATEGKKLLGNGLKLAIGVGAMKMAGNELGKLTSKMVEVKDAFNAGTLSAGGFADELIGSLPVLGEYWKAGRNLREMITGEEAAQRKEIQNINELIAVRNKYNDTLKDQRREVQELRKITKEFNDARALAKDPYAASQIEFNKTRERINAAAGDFGGMVEANGGYERGGFEKVLAKTEQQIRDKDAALEKANRQKAAADAALANSKNNPMDLTATAGGVMNLLHGKPLADSYEDAATKAEKLNAQLRGELNNLKELKIKAGEYKQAMDAAILTRIQGSEDAFAASQAMTPKGARDELEALAKARDWMDKFMGESVMGPMAGEAGEAVAKRNERMFERLPDPRLQAEELFGPKSVAGTGTGTYVEVQKETTEAVKDVSKTVEKLGDKIVDTWKAYTPQGPTINVMNF